MANRSGNKFFSVNMDVDTSILSPGSCSFDLARPAFLKYIPRLLSILDKYNIKATFFIVAKFARDKEIAGVIRQLKKDNHEIANHSLSHYKHLAYHSYKDIYSEISEADKILSDITGEKIHGFRSPGYTLSPNILRVLSELGYLYDSSLNVSILYYLAKFIFAKTSRRMSRFIRLQPFSYCFLPSQPFFIDFTNMRPSKSKAGPDNTICPYTVCLTWKERQAICYARFMCRTHRSRLVLRCSQ